MKFSKLALTYDLIQRAGSEVKRIGILTDLFRRLDQKTLKAAVHITAGEVTDPRLSDRLGIGPGTIRAALAEVSRKDTSEIDHAVKKTGDLSEVAAQYAGGSDTLTVDDLWRRTNRTVERDEDRLKLIEYIFTHTTPAGAKYFTRAVLNQMRIGVGLGTIIKALAAAFGADARQVERIFVLTNDIGLAAVRAQRGPQSLRHTALSLFHPYQFMSAHKVDDPKVIFRRLHGKPILFEVKYDGARMQIHIKKSGDGRRAEIRFYSRRLNDDTQALPDLTEALQTAWKGGDAIIEGEAVAYDPALKKKQPFQAVLMRLGRKHAVTEKARQIPLVLYLFDVVYLDGQDLMEVAQKERRGRLKTLFRSTDRVMMTAEVISDRIEVEERFFKRAIKSGHEGLIAKDLDAPYLAGKRTNYWMKLKPEFETLDVVVVGGIWGSGRRRGTLSSLILAVRDKDEFKTVGKVGTGFSEEVLKSLTAKLEPLIITSRGRQVEINPQVVLEVDFQDIQKTKAYTSGYALRIPRFKRERTDKSMREADTLERLKRLYRK
jgi:DNA ligase 1